MKKLIVILSLMLISGCCTHPEQTTFKNHMALVRGQDGFITYCTKCDKIWRAEYDCSCNPPERKSTISTNNSLHGLPW